MRRLIAFLILITGHAAPARAQVFTNLADFETAFNPGFYSNSFAGLTGNPTTFTGGTPPIGFSIAAAGGIHYSPTLTGSNFPNRPFTFSITSGSPNAFGGHFFSTNASDLFLPGVQMTITYSDGFIDTFTPTSASDFRGYVSPVPLTGVTIASSNASSFVSLNTIRMGGATPVPEPATLGLFAVAGLGGVSALRRRFRRNA